MKRRTVSISVATVLSAAVLCGWIISVTTKGRVSDSEPLRIAKYSASTAMPSTVARTVEPKPSSQAPVSPAPAAVDTPEPAIPQSQIVSIQEGIRRAEYNVSYQERSVIEGAPGGLHIANRANNLRAYFRKDGVQIVERETSDPEWDVRWQFKSWGRKGSMQRVEPVEPQSDPHTERLSYAYDDIEEWFVNTEQGLEHGFTIPERPKGDGPLMISGRFSGSAQAQQGAQPNSIAFTGPKGKQVLRYAKLLVTDANGAALPASLRTLNGITSFVLHDATAEYPIEIDPLFVPPPPTVTGQNLLHINTLEANQQDASFGRSVSGAGDVNGDGFADVIVGARGFDNGQPGEGAAFLFLGSPSGLQGTDPATAAAFLESNQNGAGFGTSVSGAGDVNGDGFADVIVGATLFDNGESDEGAAFLFLGSATGLEGTDPATAAALLEANQVGASFGWSVSGAGDVNGDGFDDVIVSALGFDNGDSDEGAAFLFLGSATGLQGNDPATAAALLESNQTGSRFGCSVSGAGDINGDGFADVIVGADLFDNGESFEGAAFLFLGSDTGLQGSDPATAASVLEANQVNAQFGMSVSGARDIDGDGFADVIVGAPNFSNGEAFEGAAFLFLGSATGLQGTDPTTAAAVLESDQAQAGFGAAVSYAGDVNGDGFADVIVGADFFDNGEFDEGAAFLFLGSATGLQGTDPTTAAAVLESNQTIARLGISVSGAGDINGDGFADVFVGADLFDNGQTSEGAAFLYLGSATGLQGTDPATAAAFLVSNQAGARFGISVSGAGDVNGDGFADVIVGADEFDNGDFGEGAAFLFLGSATGLQGTDPATAAAVLEANQASANFGTSVSGAGDVNGDGFADVIVGARHFDNGQTDEGAAFLFLGNASGLEGNNPATAANLLESNQALARLGFSVSGAGDINGDGFGDVIVGADAYGNGQQVEGAAFLFLGSATGLQGSNPATAATFLESNQEFARFGFSVSGAGDVNGDGFSDVIVGAPNFSNGESDEGATFLFLGSATGLQGSNPATAAAVLEANRQLSSFGVSVSGAGDTNGDGFGDVIVGAHLFSNGESFEGAAFLFLGSATGLQGNDPATAAAFLESNQANAQLGFSVSGAGDVNGDGFADVIVGARVFDDGETDEGTALLFLGSATGLQGNDPATAAVFLEANQANFRLGVSVSGAGDVNGDGFADVIVGAAATADAGVAFLFLGGDLPSITPEPVVARADAFRWGAPGINIGTDTIRLQLTGAAPPTGEASRIRFEYQVRPYQLEWTDVPVQVTSWVVPAPTGTLFDETIMGLTADANGHLVRMRIAHLPEQYFMPGTTEPPNPPHGRWFRPQWATPGPSDFRTSGYLPPTNPGDVAIQPMPAPARTDSDLVASVGTPSTSPANPPKTNIQYEYIWSNGSREVPRGLTTSTMDTLEPFETVKGETWTVTVRAWDGVQFSHLSASATAPVIQNTPPSAPAVTIDDVLNNFHGDGINMVARITSASADLDADEATDTVQYQFEWFQNGGGTPVVVQDFSTQLSSLVPDTQLDATDMWEVHVTPRDNEVEGTPAIVGPIEIVAGGVNPSTIFLSASPNSVTLGQAVDLSGFIFPADTIVTETVTFESTSPGSVVDPNFPTGVTTTTGVYSQPAFVPREASQGRSPWQVTASWDGDATYSAATSTPVSIEVLKAKPTLDIVPSDTSALLNFADLSVTVTPRTSLLPVTDSIWNTRQVKLFINDPTPSSVGSITKPVQLNGVTGEYEAVFAPADFTSLFSGIPGHNGFDQVGDWEFRAEFIGDDDFLQSLTANFGLPETPRLTITGKAGYAIIMVGVLDSNREGQAEHTKTADFVYRTLKGRGIADSDTDESLNDIFYLREGPAQPAPDIFVDDTTPSQDELVDAIETWAQAKILAKPAPLYVVLIGHGSVDKFYMFKDVVNNTTRVIEPGELDTAFTNLETAVIAKPAADRPIVLVYGACHSGSFIDTVSGPNRILITSSDIDEKSHRGVKDPDDPADVRDGEPFVTEFFRQARISGNTLKDAFEKASDKIREYTSTSSADGEALQPQTPLLDDDGDTLGSPAGTLSAVTGEDGALAGLYFLGVTPGSGPSRGGAPIIPKGWIETTLTQTLGDAEAPTDNELMARTELGDLSNHTAWIEIKAPSYSGSTVAAEGPANEAGEYPQDFQQEVQMQTFMSPTVNPGDGIYHWPWATISAAFTDAGTYKVFYYLRFLDPVTGEEETSEHLITTIFRTVDSRTPPDHVSLILPLGVTVDSPNVFFAWTDSIDVDGNPVTYRLEVHPSLPFPAATEDILVVKENIETTGTSVLGLSDGSYVWRIIPVDEFGASPDPAGAQVGTFIVDNTNDVSGKLNVEIDETRSGPGVTNGTVILSPGTIPIPHRGSGLYDSALAFETDVTHSLTVSIGTFTFDEATLIQIGDTETENIDLSKITFETQKTTFVTFVVAEQVGKKLEDQFSDLAGADGLLTWPEPNGAVTGLTEALFLTLDKDGNGTVSLEEILEATVGPTGNADPVYVNFNNVSGEETGQNGKGFNTLGEGAAYVMEGGTVRLKAGSSGEQLTLTKPMTIIMDQIGTGATIGN